MIETEYRYKSDISLSDFQIAVVLPFMTAEDARPAILIRNKRNKTIVTTGTTDNLEYHLNSVVEKDGESFYFHIIICSNNDGYSKEQFDFVYKYLFKRIKFAMDDNEVSQLISSLQALFKVSPEADRKKLQIGVFGELLFLYYMHQNGYPEIVKKYHSNFFSKHDVEIDSKTRIEVKTTVGSSRIHHFKHDQIFRTDVKVYIASLILEESQEGTTLKKLFDQVESFMDDPDDIFALAKLRGYCAISEEEPGPSFSFDKAIEQIKIFDAEKLPHLSDEDVAGVTEIEYNVDCSFGENIPVHDFVSILPK
jgi:hypothetical protein